MAVTNAVKAIQSEIQAYKAELAKLQGIISTLEEALAVLSGNSVKATRGRPKGAPKGKRGRPKAVKTSNGKRGRPKKVSDVIIAAETAAPASKVAKKKKSKMSPEAKKKMSEMMKKRWAERKAK